jgi:hypothetical protein
METHNSLYHLQRVYYVQWQTRTAVLGGMWLLGTGGTCDCYSLDVTILGKAAVLHFTLTPFCSWGCANPACKLFDIAVLVSHSHRFLILHSPYSHIWVKPQGFFCCCCCCFIASATCLLQGYKGLSPFVLRSQPFDTSLLRLCQHNKALIPCLRVLCLFEFPIHWPY